MQNTESKLDQSYKEYSDVVAEVLKAYYSHSLRNLPANFSNIVIDWANLCIKAGIPATQLMDIYLESHVNLERGGYFTIDNILSTWDDRREQRLQNERAKEKCTVCKGTLVTRKFDFKLRKDVDIDCPKCV